MVKLRDTRRLFLIGLLVGVLLLTGCYASKLANVAESADAVETMVAEGTIAVETPTPRPTREPGPVSSAVDDVVSSTNLDDVSFLGLTGADWINIAISAVAFFAGYFLASWLVRVVLRWLVRRTPTEFDDGFLQRIDRPIRYFILALFGRFALLRLSFWSAEATQHLENLFFLINLTILFWMAWRLIGYSIDWYKDHHEVKSAEQEDRIAKTLPLVARVLYVILIMIAFLIILSHFNLNVTAILVVIGIVGLALSLAAQDTLNDVINGMLIWMDRPFRIGDRIEIQNEQMWGDVIDIGTRSTRIRAVNNTMVVVPNSVIGKSQIVNYTYPDDPVRLEVTIMFNYDEDLDKVRNVVVQAIRTVEHVILEKPVDALFRDFGDSTIVFLVRWWIDSYVDTFYMFDQVNDAILKALREEGIEVAVPRQDLKVDSGRDELE